MKTNTYFEELDRIARDFEQKHEAHKALKQGIIDEKGWDSEELKAWYKEEEEQFQYPISAGACKAYRGRGHYGRLHLGPGATRLH